MEYREFREFWEKVTRIEDAECEKSDSCVSCVMNVGGFCLSDCPEKMTDEQFDFIQKYDFTDWSKVPIDAKIIVWVKDGTKYNRHFAGYKDGKVYAWVGGKTSFTAKTEPEIWENAKLWQGET